MLITQCAILAFCTYKNRENEHQSDFHFEIKEKTKQEKHLLLPWLPSYRMPRSWKGTVQKFRLPAHIRLIKNMLFML